jgi:hypothetical protein
LQLCSHTLADRHALYAKTSVPVFSADVRKVRIPVKWAGDSGDVGQSRSEATLVVFLH